MMKVAQCRVACVWSRLEAKVAMEVDDDHSILFLAAVMIAAS